MLRLLWCNLDPGWDFGRVVQNDCLDLAVREDVRIWDAARPVEMSQWEDWPRAVAPQDLLGDLDEILPRRGAARPLLVSIHAPDPGAPDAARGTDLLQALVERVALVPAADLLVTLPAGASLPEINQAPSAACLVARLPVNPSQNPVNAVHAQRLLMELLLDEEHAAALRDSRVAGVADVDLRPAQGQRILGRFAVQWGTLLPELRGQVQALGRVRPGFDGLDPKTLLATALREVDGLRKGQGGQVSQPPEEAMRPLRRNLPMFFRPTLGRELDALKIAFLERLDDELTRRFNALESSHQAWKRTATDKETLLADSLARLHPLSLGLGSTGQGWLQQELERAGQEREATRRSAQHLVQEIEREQRSRRHRRYGAYERHRFAEDDAFDEAVESAKAEGRGLLPRASLIRAAGIAALVAVVPVLSARLPAWQAAGFAAYAADPSTWAADLAWLLLPGGLLLLFGLYFAVRRRRRLVAAMSVAARRAEALWTRHATVLQQTFALAGHGVAMRRVDLLTRHLTRLGSELRSARDGLERLDRLFEIQEHDYRHRPRVAPPNPPRRISLLEAMRAGNTAEDWVTALVAELPRDNGWSVVVADRRLSRSATLRSDAVIGCASIDLEPVSR